MGVVLADSDFAIYIATAEQTLAGREVDVCVHSDACANEDGADLAAVALF